MSTVATTLSTTDVLIVGAGPAGLTLAADLLRRNVDVRLIDQAAAPAQTSRATSLTPRTLEVLDDIGVAQTLLDTGIRITKADAYQGSNLAFRVTFPDSDQTRFPFLLNNSQQQTELLLTQVIKRVGGSVERDRRLVAFRQNRSGVMAYVDGSTGPEEIQAKWLVGADGGRSTVRSTLGIPFVGQPGTAEETIVLADVLVDWDHPADRLYSWFNEDGSLLAFPFKEEGRWRITAALSPAEEADGRFTEEAIERFTELYRRRTGDTTSRLSDMRGFSVYRVNQRVVDQYRRGRAILVGDAAHIHTPAGGLGMNTGIQDAYNLGWRLALAVHGNNDTIVDTYEQERRPVARALLSNTGGLQQLWSIRNRQLQQIRDSALQVLLNLKPIRQAFFAGASQLNLSYRSAGLLGKRRRIQVGDRSPDGPATLWPSGGDTWLHDHLRGPQPTVLAFTGLKPANPNAGDELAALARIAAIQRTPVIRVVPVGAVITDSRTGITLIDTHNVLHQRYSATTATTAVIRPDGHLAAIGQDAQLADVVTALESMTVPSAVPGQMTTSLDLASDRAESVTLPR